MFGIHDRRVVVVGSSSGLGRSVGIGLAQGGASVAFLGRRLDRVERAAEEAGGRSVALACDVRDEVSCAAAVASAIEQLGGIDGLLYCAGVGPLAPLADADAALWRSVLETNVVGACLATQAALEGLAAAGGRAMYLSSVSASLTPPWPGLGAYAVSKAALDKLVEAFRGEHSSVGFTRIVVGDSVGGEGESATEFANGWDPQVAAECYEIWQQRAYLSGGTVGVADLTAVVATLLCIVADVPSVTVTPRPASP